MKDKTKPRVNAEGDDASCTIRAYTPQSYRVPQQHSDSKSTLGSDLTHGYTFRPFMTSNRTAHQTIASSSRASLRSRGVAGRLRIHRLATPEGRVGRDATRISKMATAQI